MTLPRGPVCTVSVRTWLTSPGLPVGTVSMRLVSQRWFITPIDSVRVVTVSGFVPSPESCVWRTPTMRPFSFTEAE